MAKDTAPVRTRPAIDTAMLVVVLACLGIAVVRAMLVAATIPYAYYTSARLASAAKAAGVQPPTTRISERVAGSRPFESWWGGRRVPYREGGDYLGVLSHHQTERSLGVVIGVLAARDSLDGSPTIRRVVLPKDRDALYGEDSGTLMTKADGTHGAYVVGAAVARHRVPLACATEMRPYNPVLTAEQAQRLEANADLVERAEDFFVGAPRAGRLRERGSCSSSRASSAPTSSCPSRPAPWAERSERRRATSWRPSRSSLPWVGRRFGRRAIAWARGPTTARPCRRG